MNSKKKEFPNDTLSWIPGGGCTAKPKFMLLFINPTARNLSSDPAWQGVCFPWIGVLHFWKWLQSAGFFDAELVQRMTTKGWSSELAQEVLEYLEKNKLYITNIVKRTGHDAALPNATLRKLFLPLLKKEIELVQPERIIAFGLLPYEALTNKKIKLGEYYSTVISLGKLQAHDANLANVKVIPCYFPMGRGSPKKAREILQLLNKNNRF